MGNIDWKWLIVGAVLGWLLSAYTCHKNYGGAYPTYASALIT